MWSWLVHVGHIYPAIVGWAVGALMGLIAGFIIHNSAWKKLRHFVQSHERTQEMIADRLDTSTPGGLGTIKEALEGLSETERGQE